ncbi:MAG: helix-turn-helix domain-containing protein, partial [Bacteroidota bacterium]
PFYYPTLIVNSLFIYWIGYVGFSKPSSFFSAVRTTAPPADKWEPVQEALRRAMEEEEVFTNAKLTLPQFAQQVGLPARDITQYVNEVKGMNFSEYLNHYRVKKVQRLMLDEEAQRYTLIALAEAAGFSSKSSFNAIFKKEVGQTPTEFLRSRNAT